MNWICILFHKWEYGYLCDPKGQLTAAKRECERCGKEQVLVDPDKYHPTKQVWKDAKI